MNSSTRLSFVVSGISLLAVLNGPHPTFIEASAAQAVSAANRNGLITVTSKDGTRIGVECAGTGPTVLFVHGGVGDRTRWTPMFPLLTSKFTACAIPQRVTELSIESVRSTNVESHVVRGLSAARRASTKDSA